MRVRKMPAVALVAVVAGLSLTACGGGGSDDATATTPPAAPSAPASSTQDAGSAGTPAAPTASTGSTSGGSDGAATAAPTAAAANGSGTAAGRCATANLSVTATHGMGEGDIVVAFLNNGGTCTLHGFPGVDLKGKDGTISAARSSLKAPDVTLRHGESARATLHYPPNTSGGSGTTFTTLVVTPPNETHSRSVPISINLPVSDGSGPGVSVDPVGTGK